MEAKYPQKIKLAVLPYNDFIGLNISDGGEVEFSGVESRFLEVVLNSLGFQYDFLIPRDGQSGKLLPSGNWSGLIGMVQRGEADMAFSYIGMTESRSKVVQYSTPYAFDEFTFVSQMPRNRRYLFSFFHSFDHCTWLCLFLAFILISYILAIFKRNIRLVGNYTFRLFGSILGHSVKINDNSIKFKLVIMVWMFSVRVIIFCFSGILLSLLIAPFKEDSVRDFFELSKAVLEGRYQAKLSDISLRWIFKSDKEYLLKLGKFVVEKNWISEIKYVNSDTYIKPAFCLGIYRVMGNLYFGARNDIFFSEDRLYLGLAAFAYNERFCCILKLNTILLRAASAGLYQKILKDESIKLFLKSAKFSDSSEPVSPLSIDTVLGPLAVSGVGIFVSLVIFLLEVTHTKYT